MEPGRKLPLQNPQNGRFSAYLTADEFWVRCRIALLRDRDHVQPISQASLRCASSQLYNTVLPFVPANDSPWA